MSSTIPDPNKWKFVVFFPYPDIKEEVTFTRIAIRFRRGIRPEILKEIANKYNLSFKLWNLRIGMEEEPFFVDAFIDNEERDLYNEEIQNKQVEKALENIKKAGQEIDDFIATHPEIF